MRRQKHDCGTRPDVQMGNVLPVYERREGHEKIESRLNTRVSHSVMSLSDKEDPTLALFQTVTGEIFVLHSKPL